MVLILMMAALLFLSIGSNASAQVVTSNLLYIGDRSAYIGEGLYQNSVSIVNPLNVVSLHEPGYDLNDDIINLNDFSGPVRGVAFFNETQASGPGKYLSTGQMFVTDGNLIYVYLLPFNILMKKYDIGIATTGYMVASPDGSKLYVVCADGSIAMIDLKAEKQEVVYTGAEEIWGITISPDGNYLYVSDYYDARVLEINTADKTIKKLDCLPQYTGAWYYNGHKCWSGGQAGNVKISPDGRYLYVGLWSSNNLAVIDTTTDTLAATITMPYRSCHGVTVSPDGKYVYATNFDGDTVSVIDTASRAVVRTIRVGSGSSHPSYISVSPDGKYLAIGFFNDVVKVVLLDNSGASHDVIGYMPVASGDQGGCYYGYTVEFGPQVQTISLSSPYPTNDKKTGAATPVEITRIDRPTAYIAPSDEPVQIGTTKSYGDADWGDRPGSLSDAIFIPTQKVDHFSMSDFGEYFVDAIATADNTLKYMKQGKGDIKVQEQDYILDKNMIAVWMNSKSGTIGGTTSVGKEFSVAGPAARPATIKIPISLYSKMYHLNAASPKIVLSAVVMDVTPGQGPSRVAYQKLDEMVLHPDQPGSATSHTINRHYYVKFDNCYLQPGHTYRVYVQQDSSVMVDSSIFTSTASLDSATWYDSITVKYE